MKNRILAIMAILLATSGAWVFLSATIDSRTNDRSFSMSDSVGGLWGDEQNQFAPIVNIAWEEQRKSFVSEPDNKVTIGPIDRVEKQVNSGGNKEREERSQNQAFRLIKDKHNKHIDLAGSVIKVDLDLDHRKKGLLWFSAYAVEFTGDYTVQNPLDRKVAVTMTFPFPGKNAIFDNLKVEAPNANDLEYHIDKIRSASRIVATFSLPPKGRQTLKFGYKSRGLNQWTYSFGKQSRLIKNFNLTMHTDFCNIDFPRNSISPDKKIRNASSPGWTLNWEKESLVSTFRIGMVMPQRLNPGPLAAAMSSHAPVSLLFFFFVIFLLQVLRGIKIHPMNYFFLACSFFAFNLLFSYLVDHVDLWLSFAISSAVSIFLVTSYLRLVVSARFALVEAGLSQFIYQILFAFAHFFKGITGLSITIGAILTLAVVMRLTAKIDWEKEFKDKGPKVKYAIPEGLPIGKDSK